MTREDNGELIYSGTYQGPDGSRNLETSYQ